MENEHKQKFDRLKSVTKAFGLPPLKLEYSYFQNILWLSIGEYKFRGGSIRECLQRAEYWLDGYKAARQSEGDLCLICARVLDKIDGVTVIPAEITREEYLSRVDRAKKPDSPKLRIWPPPYYPS